MFGRKERHSAYTLPSHGVTKVLMIGPSQITQMPIVKVCPDRQGESRRLQDDL